ncbi:MAG: 50S ribosomal protein L23 [Bdellovibrionales bacterium]|nr:50S ribosomal protein L23 [Bdellovibrionales bacterium]
MYQVIKRPLITEKNSLHQAANVFAFEVDRDADKIQIRKAVEQLFQVKVLEVRTAVCRNRSRRVGSHLSRIKYWKKAMVKLAPGEKISLFEGV